jgi:lysophospholipase L1-like esterase
MFNEHVTARAARHRLALTDLHALSRELAPGRPERFCPDGFHPSESGYEQWAECMYPAVEALLREEASVR